MGKLNKLVTVIKHGEKAYKHAKETHGHLKSGNHKEAFKSAVKTVKHSARAVDRAKEVKGEKNLVD